VVFPRAGLYKSNLCVPCTLLTHLPTLSRFSCIVMAHSESAMLNIEDTREIRKPKLVEPSAPLGLPFEDLLSSQNDVIARIRVRPDPSRCPLCL
jgi:hypothetical protein